MNEPFPHEMIDYKIKKPCKCSSEQSVLSEKIKQIRGMSGIWQQAMARAEKQNNSLNYTRFSERVIGLELALKVLEEK